jgi:hypothetical protein
MDLVIVDTNTDTNRHQRDAGKLPDGRTNAQLPRRPGRRTARVTLAPIGWRTLPIDELDPRAPRACWLIDGPNSITDLIGVASTPLLRWA